VWVALRDPTHEELRTMQEEFDLHDLAVEDALKGLQRPKLEEYGKTLFAVMRLVEPDDGELNVGDLAVFVGHNFVLSVRSRSKRTFWACAPVASASRCCCAWARALCSMR
jgi:magnesium transporter